MDTTSERQTSIIDIPYTLNEVPMIGDDMPFPILPIVVYYHSEQYRNEVQNGNINKLCIVFLALFIVLAILFVITIGFRTNV